MAGIETRWSCEYEPYQRSVLKRHYPHTKQYDDVRTLQNPGYVDIISGGFPCQDISLAGKGVGITGERSGLWREMYRIIRDVRPRYVLIENSPALLFRGFERVLCDLSESGYNAEWQCISNLAFGYPHLRERVYVIAYSHQVRQQSLLGQNGVPEAIFKRWTPKKNYGYSIAKGIYQMPEADNIRAGDGVRHWVHRTGSIGNAVNPYVAHYLFECIKLHYNSLICH